MQNHYENHDDQCCKTCTSPRLKWSGLCMSIFGAVFIGVALFVPAFIHQQIHDGIIDYQVLSPSSRDSNTDSYASWSDWTSSTAQPTLYTARMLNVTNPDEVVEGGRPIVKEVGPYIFREYKQRFNVSFGVDAFGHSIVTFREWVYYVFDEQQSAPLTLSDVFTTPNMVFQGLVETAVTLPFLNGIILAAYGPRPLADRMFTKLNVTNILFGYNDPVLAQYGLPSFFAGLVGNTTSIPLTQPFDAMYTGDKNELDRTRSYVQWKNAKYLIQSDMNPSPVWGSPEANRVRGSDATTFRPFLPVDRISSSSSNAEPTILEAWVSDAYRTLSLVHTADIDFKGITLQRYRIHERSIQNATLNPDNAAYYMFGPSGAFNLTINNNNVPVFLTKPHFLDADAAISSLVDGLSPNVDAHDTFIDVEPLSGVTMHGAKRLQVNLNVKPVTVLLPAGNVTWFQNMRNDILLPMVWLEESGTMSDSQASDFKNTVVLLTKFANISLYAFYVVGNFLIGLGVMFFFVAISRNVNSNVHNVNNGEYNEPLYTAPYAAPYVTH